MRKFTAITLVFAVLAFTAASSALEIAAQQHGDATQPHVEAQNGVEGDHGGGEAGLFSGNLGNVIWTLAIFFALLATLGKFAWGPILSALEGRERFIRESLEQARANREEAEARLAEYEAKLAAARQEVEAVLEEGRRDAAALRRREEERAKDEAEKILARARREIDIAKDTAVKDLYERAAHLSMHVAARVLQRELKPEDHARLVEEAIESLEARETH